MKVADILKAKENSASLVHPAVTIREVLQRLHQDNSGAVIVSDDEGSLDGIVTESDVAHGIATHGSKLLDLPASALATTAVVSCSPGDSITDVARVMTERHLHHIPVRVGGRLLDVISIVEVLEERLHDRRRVARAIYGMTAH